MLKYMTYFFLRHMILVSAYYPQLLKECLTFAEKCIKFFTYVNKKKPVSFMPSNLSLQFTKQEIDFSI